jgi:hypothetical protein
VIGDDPRGQRCEWLTAPDAAPHELALLGGKMRSELSVEATPQLGDERRRVRTVFGKPPARVARKDERVVMIPGERGEARVSLHEVDRTPGAQTTRQRRASARAVPPHSLTDS